ncbi:hypothetical protein [Acrocarpospora phusangensis]|uniref:hypothetical protein n=1 Tax=Acrocarpospora phusangensis TaxID=1070424 RepID=UPI0019525041|nr:hypothetical protein [Acrocarpospora phusangensis]
MTTPEDRSNRSEWPDPRDAYPDKRPPNSWEEPDIDRPWASRDLHPWAYPHPQESQGGQQSRPGPEEWAFPQASEPHRFPSPPTRQPTFAPHDAEPDTKSFAAGELRSPFPPVPADGSGNSGQSAPERWGDRMRQEGQSAPERWGDRLPPENPSTPERRDDRLPPASPATPDHRTDPEHWGGRMAHEAGTPGGPDKPRETPGQPPVPGQPPQPESPYGGAPGAYGPPGGYQGLPGYPPPGGGSPYGPGGGQYPATPQRGGGLGTAALVLGIVSIVLLFLCGLGTLTAIAGVIVGIVAIAKRSNKPRAIVGLVLSIATLVLAAILAAVLWNWVQSKGIDECFDTTLHPTQESAQRCLERKLNTGTLEN